MAKKKLKRTTTKEPDIEDLIHPISESGNEEGTTALVYGGPGTGKTAFGSTWPKPLLLLDIQEKGTRTIRHVEGIDRIQVDTWDILDSTYWWLEKKKREYATILLDQVTQAQDLAIAKSRGDNDKADDALITKQMWGEISGLMKRMLLPYRDLRNMGYNVVFVAHERMTAGDDSAEDDQIDPSVGPRLMPSLSSFANGMVDIIGNTFIRERFVGPKKEREVEYCMRIGPHGFYATKIRTPYGKGVKVPGVIANPTFEKVMRISQGLTSKPIKKIKR